MGFLKQLFGIKVEKPINALFKVPQEALTVYAPVAGTVIPLADVNDGVFSEEILGKGCAIIPNTEIIYAPFDGVIESVAETKHAVGITSKDGMELLIHVGLDTVDMNGRGFEVFVKNGETVVCGQPLLKFSKNDIAEAGHSDMVMIVVLNSDFFTKISLEKQGEILELDKLLKLE